MKKSTIIVLVVVAVLAFYTWSTYNRLITLNEQSDAQWSQVENQYQRRFDLIPNLVNSVKGSMAQEQKVFGDIAEARSHYSGAQTINDKAKAAGEVEGALSRLLVIMENYPQLNSIQVVSNLMVDLEGSENRVSVERNRFNETIRDYNLIVKRIPGSIIASIFGFDEREYFESAEGAEKAPTVNLE